MSKEVFCKLCDILVQSGGLRLTQKMSVKEQVAMFLHIVVNDKRNWFIS